MFFDTEYSFLEEVLGPIDSSLLEVNRNILEASIWDVGFLCDKGEYLIGLGFCIMQRYMFNVLMDVDIKPNDARLLGPRSSVGEPVAELIHSAANYWKHEPEWHIWLEKINGMSQKTVDKVLHHRDSAQYPLSDLLADLNGSYEITLVGCLPYLTQWREAVFRHVEKNTQKDS
ncbi:MAG: hypothetical protein ACQEW0_05050 [Pseudomonadota bacterium]